jgi:hypothetical protein
VPLLLLLLPLLASLRASALFGIPFAPPGVFRAATLLVG